VWKDARFESEVSGLRSDTSDDRFFLLESGIEFPVGGAPSNPAKSLVKPSPTLDAENYLIRGGYEKNITSAFFWNAGLGWDRNDWEIWTTSIGLDIRIAPRDEVTAKEKALTPPAP
jgi:hypothetical protein